MALADNIMRLKERIAAACAAAGRRESEIAVVAATKCVPADVVYSLPAYGITAAGENRVQEFTEKYRASSPLSWHIIGALQTNKVKYAVGKACMIQSVDRLALAEEISRRSITVGVVTDVLTEINIGGEESKSGVRPEEAQELCAHMATLPGIRLRGLMSVPPQNAPAAMYERLRALFDRLRSGYDAFDVLSVGMSNDFETAIRYGTTMIRPGRILFGERNAYE